MPPVWSAGPDPHCDSEEGCLTCGDVAVPMRVLAIDDERCLALCADGDGRRETVEIALVQPVATDDELLVHAATAIAKLSEEHQGAKGPTAPGRGSRSRSPRRSRGPEVIAGAEEAVG